MKSFLKNIVRWINAVNELVGQVASWLTLILVVLVCFDVTTRYLFDDTATWIMELEWHLFAMIFLFGAGYAMKYDRHVRVDLFYEKFSPRDKAWINLLGAIIFLIPWCVVIIYVSYHYAYESYLINEGSPDPGGLPNRYIIKFAITIGISLLLLQAISTVASSSLILMGTEENEEQK